MGYRGLPRGRDCPLCGGETLRLRARWLKLVRLRRGVRLHARWCLSCGWEGTARVREVRTERGAAAAPVEAVGGTRMIELSELRLDGRAWRVLLQAWAEQGAWRGQLLFVGPVGRIVSDGLARFSGGSYQEVVRQASSLSETVLAVRLRSMMSSE
jgi:hypothetical protein